MTDTNTTPLYRPKNNGKYMNFQARTEKDSELADLALRGSPDKLAEHGEQKT
jgi:hypothetical protein